MRVSIMMSVSVKNRIQGDPDFSSFAFKALYKQFLQGDLGDLPEKERACYTFIMDNYDTMKRCRFKGIYIFENDQTTIWIVGEKAVDGTLYISLMFPNEDIPSAKIVEEGFQKHQPAYAVDAVDILEQLTQNKEEQWG